MTESITELQRSILALASRKSLLEPALKEAKRPHPDDCAIFSLCNYIVLISSSFYAEWITFKKLSRSNATVKETVDICEPAISVINRYPQLRPFRNSVLAHPRRKDNSLPLLEEMMNSPQFPKNYAEQILVGECAVYCIAAVLIRHDNDRRAGLRALGPIRITEPVSGINSLAEMEAEISRIRALMINQDPALELGFGVQ